MPLERFSAAWREEYVAGTSSEVTRCVFCSLASEDVAPETGVLWRSTHAYAVLNAFPYGSGHVLVVPYAHVGEIEDLDASAYEDLFLTLRRVVVALKAAYGAEGLNVGMNLGQAGGAGIPQHVHVHALPRWLGDTNFMTTIGETRVLPESLASTWQKVHAALGPS
jgi:ATP adenylyltransferase